RPVRHPTPGHLGRRRDFTPRVRTPPRRRSETGSSVRLGPHAAFSQRWREIHSPPAERERCTAAAWTIHALLLPAIIDGPARRTYDDVPMPARTGAAYIAGLREHPPELHMQGERVKDVTSHPGLRHGVQTLAALYDMQHDPALRDDMTYESPTTG